MAAVSVGGTVATAMAWTPGGGGAAAHGNALPVPIGVNKVARVATSAVRNSERLRPDVGYYLSRNPRPSEPLVGVCGQLGEIVAEAGSDHVDVVGRAGMASALVLQQFVPRWPK